MHIAIKKTDTAVLLLIKYKRISRLKKWDAAVLLLAKYKQLKVEY